MYSHSRISCFENCQLQFKYKYLDKLSDGSTSIEAFLGSRVHDALEKLYTDKQFHKNMSEKELIAFYENNWEQHWSDNVRIVRTDYSAENYKDMGRSYLRDYYRRYQPFSQARTIGIEKRIVITLPSGKQIQGYIDRLDEREGVYEIHDYKTAAHLMEQGKADQDRQLALYAISVKEQFPDAQKIRLIWHYLAFDKEITSERSEEELEQLKQDVDEIIKKIEAETEFKAKTSALCDWCEFRSICPQWSHLVGIEHKTPEEFTQDEGVKLADAYVKLSAQKQELEKELDSLKEQLYTYGEQFKVDTIFGTSMKLRLWKGENYRFPAKDTLQRKELVEELKRLGKLEEANTLDTWHLSKLMKGWDELSRSAIARYAQKITVKKIYPSRRS